MRKLNILKGTALSVLALSLAACSSTRLQAVTPLQGPPVQLTTTPYSPVLKCLSKYTATQKKLSIAVGLIPDRTGKFSVYDGGYKVTQGAEDMAISSIGETKSFVQVERQQLNIPIFELKYADQYLLRDIDPAANINSQGKVSRAIQPGMFLGSDYVLTGSITEVNYNVDSGGAEVYIAGVGGGWRTFWFDIGLDLRVVNTKTGEIVMTIPERKQLWGYESKAGVARFFNNTYVNANAGKLVEEPVGLAVRSVIDSAVINMTKYLYKLPADTCANVQAQIDSSVSRPTLTKK